MRVGIRGQVVAVRRLRTTRGTEMARFQLRFHDGEVPCVAFPGVWSRIRRRVRPGALLVCEGELAQDDYDLTMFVIRVTSTIR